MNILSYCAISIVALTIALFCNENALVKAEKLTKQKLEKGYKKVEISNEKAKIEKEKKMKTTDYYAELVKFDAKSNLLYAQSFWIVDDEEDFFEGWLHDTPEDKVKEYAQSMKIFASADGTGARYAFWFTDGNTDKNKAPIICYGSEGAIVIVAENIKDLIKMLSFGAEGMDGHFYHYIDNDDEDDDYDFYKEFLKYTPRHLEFREWMKDTLNIEPLNLDKLINDEEEESEEIEKLQKKARKKLQKSFDKWQNQFYKSEAELHKEYVAKCQKKYDKNKAELLEKIAKKPTADLFYKLSQNETVLDEVNQKQKELYLEKALALDENHKESLIKLAEHNSYSNPKKAIEFYKKLITISDKPEEYYSDIASAYKYNKNYTKAIDYYVKDIIATPNQYGAYSQGYIVDICKETKQDAIAILENITKKVTSANTHLVLYKLYYKKKNYPKAAENVLLYITHSDEQAHNYTSIAERFFEKEQYKEALAIFEKTIDRHDWDECKMRNYNYIGLCAMRLDTPNLEKAHKAFLEAYKLDSKEKAVKQNLVVVASLYLEKKELDKAEEILKFCLENLNYKKANLHYLLGSVYVEKDEFQKALIQFEKALALKPNNGKYKKSIADVQKIIDKDKGFLGRLFGTNK